MNSALFICQLSKENQEKIRKEIYDYLVKEEFGENEISEILKNAMDCRLVEVEEFINIEQYLKSDKVIYINR